jgi:hypothetical protein
VSTLAKNEQFQIHIGDTERSVEEIIDNIRKSDLPIAHIKQTSASSNQTGRGATLTLQTTSDTLSQEDLEQLLNKQGGCMYQVESVTKSSK